MTERGSVSSATHSCSTLFTDTHGPPCQGDGTVWLLSDAYTPHASMQHEAKEEAPRINPCRLLVVMSIHWMRIALEWQGLLPSNHHNHSHETVPTRLYRGPHSMTTAADDSPCGILIPRMMGWFGASLKSCNNERSLLGRTVSCPMSTGVLSTHYTPTSHCHWQPFSPYHTHTTTEVAAHTRSG